MRLNAIFVGLIHLIAAVSFSTAIQAETVCPEVENTATAAASAKCLETRVEALEATNKKLIEANTALLARLKKVETAGKVLGASKVMFVHKETSCPSGWRKLGQAGFIVQRQRIDRNFPTGFDMGGEHGRDTWRWMHPEVCVVER